MTKPKDEMQRECEQCVEDCLHARFDVGVGNIDAEEWNEKVAAKNTAFDAYAQAAVDAALDVERRTQIVMEANHDEGQYEEDADTLGMLEVIAKRSRLLALGQLPPEPVYVSYEGDTFVYYRSPTGEHVTRDEARALLAGKGEKE